MLSWQVASGKRSLLPQSEMLKKWKYCVPEDVKRGDPDADCRLQVTNDTRPHTKNKHVPATEEIFI